MDTSKLFKINLKDLCKGAIVAVGAALFKFIYDAAARGTLFSLGAPDLKNMANIAVAAFIGYLIKQVFTDENNKLLGVL